MSALAVVCLPSDFEQLCYRALSKFLKYEIKIQCVIIGSNKWSDKERSSVISLCDQLGATVVFVNEFDGSAVTQDNVKKLRDLIEDKGVSVVLIPLIDSPNELRRIVGRSSLLAARSLQNILMYEPDVTCKDFAPDLLVHADDGNQQMSQLTPMNGDLRHMSDRTQSAASGFESDQNLARFQIHRIVLNSNLFETLSEIK